MAAIGRHRRTETGPVSVELFNRYRRVFLQQSGEADRLAGIYVAEGVIPVKHLTEVFLIALAWLRELDLLSA
ncbi:MAG: hypothetical protein LBT47_13015 [Deltaproteobacteria bacterium]|nr:hypothetical protein [Deltaproteobacteria bacterium]